MMWYLIKLSQDLMTKVMRISVKTVGIMMILITVCDNKASHEGRTTTPTHNTALCHILIRVFSLTLEYQ